MWSSFVRFVEGVGLGLGVGVGVGEVVVVELEDVVINVMRTDIIKDKFISNEDWMRELLCYIGCVDKTKDINL